MKKVNNQDFLNAIKDQASLEYQEKVPNSTTKTGSDVFAILSEYPTLKNEFLNVLTNKVAKTIFFSKVFENPLKMLHKGLLPYGKSIEEVFVDMAEKKAWGTSDHFTGSTTVEGDLIKPLKPTASVDYLTQNFAYKFKTSVSDSQLRGAFTSQNGLTDLVSQIVNSLSSSVYYHEYTDMKKLLVNTVADTTGGSTIGEGLISQVATSLTSALIKVSDTLELAKKIRAMASTLSFPSTAYNLSGVNTWTNKEDLVLFITPDVQADLDVDVLAHAFNVSSADVNIRTIVVDDLGTTGDVTPVPVACVLADKDLLQVYDTINETNTFYNAEQMTTNYFAHKHGIMGLSKFCNAVVFTY